MNLKSLCGQVSWWWWFCSNHWNVLHTGVANILTDWSSGQVELRCHLCSLMCTMFFPIMTSQNICYEKCLSTMVGTNQHSPERSLQSGNMNENTCADGAWVWIFQHVGPLDNNTQQQSGTNVKQIQTLNSCIVIHNHETWGLLWTNPLPASINGISV